MTSVFSYIPQSDPPLPPHLTLPTMYDLPSENALEPGLPDDFHFLQPLTNIKYPHLPGTESPQPKSISPLLEGCCWVTECDFLF